MKILNKNHEASLNTDNTNRNFFEWDAHYRYLNKVLDLFCGEKCGLKRPLAEKALEALKRGGVFVTPNDQRDIIPLQRAHFTPDKELITLVPIGKLVDGKVVLDSITVPKLENIGSLESLPRFEHPLQGSNEVKIQNPNTFAVTVALRSGKGGKDFQVPPNSSNSAFVPDGNYDIYFVYSNQSDALFQGDSFSLHANGVEIQIVKVIDGNYEIRRVK